MATSPSQGPDIAPTQPSEKGLASASAQGVDNPSEHPRFRLHSGHRLRKLLRPNGRRVHIAATPEEHVRLTRTLPNIEPDDNFDCYVHGSNEHLEAVREIHAHHEQRRLHLRHTHGNVYDEMEHVKTELDFLADDLNHLSDHGVSLDANFSKFGYDAHIRTRAPESSFSSSSISGDGLSMPEKRDWNAERGRGQALRFWKKPTIRQYWHKGLLWRASENEEVASFELFVDLLYVGILAVVGDAAAEHADGFGLLRFSITFILGWKMWSDLTLIVSWFETNDIFQRILVLFVMVCLFGFTLNIAQAFESTWTQMISFYLASRLFNAVHYLWIGWLIPMVRGYMIINAIMVAIPSAVWIASIQVEYPDRLALIWVAIVLDLFGVLAIVWFKRFLEKQNPELATRKAKWFDFFPAINIEHKTERTNAFVTLVFGYSVVALLFQNKAPFGINAFFGKAVLGLIQAFAFNWLYFEIDSWNLHTHAIRRHYVSSMVWMTAHLPFIMAYVLAGAALSKLVLVRDSHGTNPHDLTEAYVEKSEAEVPQGLRWFYCAGFGIALLCMGIISSSHIHKVFDGQRINKKARLANRIVVAIILICLPLAESLESLELISVVTGLVIYVLMVDVYGSTSIHDDFWKCTNQCKYRADCPLKKTVLVDAVKRGTKIKLEEVQTDEGEKVLYEFKDEESHVEVDREFRSAVPSEDSIPFIEPQPVLAASYQRVSGLNICLLRVPILLAKSLTAPLSVTRSHKQNDRDHAGLADGTAEDIQHLPRYFSKSGHIDADPKKVKKEGGGKGNWQVSGTPGDESQDYGYNFTNARRRSNSSSHGHALDGFKTKFEAVETDPVFEEDIHGAKDDAGADQDLTLEKGESADSVSTVSIEEEDLKKV